MADRIWYPVWDSGVRVDHSVRRPSEMAAVAADDLRAALGLLDLRLLAGDVAVAGAVREQLRADWRTRAPERLPDLRALCDERAASAGELAYLLEPDLKEAHGGLRDTTVLRGIGRDVGHRRAARRSLRGDGAPARRARRAAPGHRSWHRPAEHAGPGRGGRAARRERRRAAAPGLGLRTHDRLRDGPHLAPRRAHGALSPPDGPVLRPKSTGGTHAARPTAWWSRTARSCWRATRGRRPTRRWSFARRRPRRRPGCGSRRRRWSGSRRRPRASRRPWPVAAREAFDEPARRRCERGPGVGSVGPEQSRSCGCSPSGAPSLSKPQRNPSTASRSTATWSRRRYRPPV